MELRRLVAVVSGFLCLVLVLTAPRGYAQAYFTLHTFSTNNDGRPRSGLVLSGTTLYGTAPLGGTFGQGVLFRINTDGTGFSAVKNFAETHAEPEGGLALADTTLYGTTPYGGISNCGTIFKVNTDGRGYTVLKSFAGGDDARYPGEDLALSGTTLYGVTGSGGISNNGTLFKINTDGSGYAVLKRFRGGLDGAAPKGKPVVSGSALYGITSSGGVSGRGFLYKINTDGSAYAVFHDFTNSSEGVGLWRSPVLSGTTLYGATSGGGISNKGVVFSLRTDGSGYTVLKNFTGGDEGAGPGVSVLSGTRLYGFAWLSNPSRNVMFEMNLDGTAYTIIHQFTNTSEGTDPNFGLTLSGGMVYGTTWTGGSGDNGVVFGLVLPTTAPNLFAPPQSQAVAMGSSLSFVVGASGAPTLTYQWFFNGTPLGSASTNSCLTLTNVTLANAGNYAVTVNNGFGSVTSPPATLDVIAPGDTTVRTCTEQALRLALNQGTNVLFACDGTITLGSTIIIATNTVLDANGHQVTVSGGNLVRVFQVNSNVHCTLIGLTIANGFATSGGGLANDGAVDAQKCVFLGNLACGVTAPFLALPPVRGGDGRGAAILNTGSFNADYCSFYENLAAGGGGSDYGVAGAYPWGVAVPGAAGGHGQGGAVCNLGEMSIQRSLFASNTVAGGPGGGGMNGWASGDQVGSGASGARGGNGAGAALYNTGALTLSNCTLAWNTAAGGSGGVGGAGGQVVHNGFLIQGGNGRGGNGGDGSGALYSTNATLWLNYCTIARNSCSGGVGGKAGHGLGPPTLDGAVGTAKGAIVSDVSLFLNTIVADNSPSNCSGTLTDAGHNLSSDASCAFTGQGSKNNINPGLGLLADNGGSTPTMGLLAASPAIDAADPATAPLTDQRGGIRPAGTAPDIGAYEYGSLPLMHIESVPAGSCTISLSEVVVPSCRLLTTTDFLHWSPLATNQVGANRTVLFQVPVAPDEAGRFYRIALP